ncbi:MAG: HAMP domain-containing histidine kinase [Cyclobacteriaceae bacterium]|nr:HAMP domain-containing histidine kinase [Cyclobacteriaceae bacterium]
MRPTVVKVNHSYFLLSAILILLVSAYLDWDARARLSNEVMRIESRLEDRVSDARTEIDHVLKNLKETDWTSINHPLFLIDNNELVKWSSNEFIPDLRLGQSDTSYVLLKNSAGDFLYKRIQISETQYLLSVITLHRKYLITNQYLNSSLSYDLFRNVKGRIESTSYGTGEYVKLRGTPLFRFVFSDVKETSFSYLVFFLASVGLMLLIMGVSLWLRSIHQKSHYGKVFIISALLFIALRVAMIYLEYPGRWISISLFDPQIFASSSYNPSIGDLLLNSLGVFFICLYGFFYYSKFNVTKRLLNSREGLMRSGVVLILLAGAYFALVFPFLFVEIIFHNSTIVLDITESLQLNFVRAVSWISILLGSISAFLFFHVLVRLSKRLIHHKTNLFILNLLSASLFIAYFTLAERDYWITLIIGFILINTLIIFKLSEKMSIVQFDSFVYLFVILTALGMQYGLSIRMFSEEGQRDENLKVASNFIIGRDILAEYLLSETSKRIAEDTYIQNAFSNPFVNRALIREKIRQLYLNSYFDRYEVRTNLFSPSGMPSGDVVENIFSSQFNISFQPSYETDYDGIYFVRPEGAQSSNRYISIIPIYKANALMGYVLLDLLLKRIIPENVYPELLVDRRFSQYYNNGNKSFAVVLSNRVVSSFGDYNYVQDFDLKLLDNDRLFTNGIKVKSLRHYAIAEGNNQVVIISEAAYTFFNLLTNFSFFFVAGIFSISLVLIARFLISFYLSIKLNYAARIQLIIFILFSLPLLVAAITTLSRLSESAENQLASEFQRKTRQLSEGINSVFSDYLNNTITRNELESEIADRAKQANSDITIYNNKGKYQVSSQPLIFENQLTSGLLDPQIYNRILNGNELSIIENESIGTLKFNNCYQAIMNTQTGELLGVLSMPYFNSESSLESTKINVLSNFLTIFTIIFILFSILSFYIVNWLTVPLRFITKALGKTTLSAENKLLKWNSTDEIGLMVTEYNRMVTNLEQSKIALARSQKESAWREIAKQVAHEIKNPLTPMKLTLQQMEYQLQNKNLDDEKVKKALNAMLMQIEILNEIATSFSTFARMPAPIMNRVELIKLLKDCTNLYADSEMGEVVFTSEFSELFVMGDEQLLSRIFSNLILNGLQSGTGHTVKVDISLKLNTENVIISIKDNGSGIDAEMAEKIFIPYFSTKKSGSGLGLAISKQGIEQSGGDIWFETSPVSGTTFYVKLPRVD